MLAAELRYAGYMLAFVAVLLAMTLTTILVAQRILGHTQPSAWAFAAVALPVFIAIAWLVFALTGWYFRSRAKRLGPRRDVRPLPPARYAPIVISLAGLAFACFELARNLPTGRGLTSHGVNALIMAGFGFVTATWLLIQDWRRRTGSERTPPAAQRRLDDLAAARALPPAERRIALRPMYRRFTGRLVSLVGAFVAFALLASRIGEGFAFLASLALAAGMLVVSDRVTDRNVNAAR